MKKSNIKKIISLTITKKLLKKKLYLVLENSFCKEVKFGEGSGKNFNITKRNVKFSEFSNTFDIKNIKLPLSCKYFINYRNLTFYLNSIQKRKNSLPVFIKAKYLAFKSTKLLDKYYIDEEKVVNKINTLNIGSIKLILILKLLRKNFIQD
jgi:hypothetical protein